MTEKSKRHITVASIVGIHGLKGGIKAHLETDFPDRFIKGTKYFLAPPLPMLSELTLKEVFSSGKHLVFYFEEITNLEEAKRLIGRFLQISQDQLFPIGEDSFFLFEIEGAEVFFDNGKPLGRVTEIISTNAGEVFEIDTESRKVLLPAIKKLVLKIDREKRIIILNKKIYMKEFRFEE